MSTPEISLINNIRTPPNSPKKYTLATDGSGANTHLANEATPKMAPVIMSKHITARLPDITTMESSHVATIHIPGLTRKSRKNHITPKFRAYTPISLGVIFS